MQQSETKQKPEQGQPQPDTAHRPADERQKRLGKALRENLLRRKADAKTTR